MNEAIAEFIKVLTDGANNVAALSSSGVLALVCFYLGWRNYQNDKESNERYEKDFEMRMQKAIVESKTADTLAKLGDAYERLAEKQEIAINLIGRVSK